MPRRYFTKHLTSSQLQSINEHIDGSFATNISLGESNSHDCAIIFFDLCNFTNISWSLNGDQILSILQDLFKKVSSNVAKHNGMIDKYPGDGVVAFFPWMYTDDGDYIAEYALDCATEVMYWFYNHMRYRYDLPKSSHRLDLSIGIDAGWISIAHVGSVHHSELILLGDQVNCASKCQGAAEAKEIIIGQEAAERVRNIYSNYFSTGPNIGVVYTKTNQRYLSHRFDWENFSRNSSWIDKS